MTEFVCLFIASPIITTRIIITPASLSYQSFNPLAGTFPVDSGSCAVGMLINVGGQVWHAYAGRAYLQRLSAIAPANNSGNSAVADIMRIRYIGGAENDGPSKLRGMKLQDMKLQDMTNISIVVFTNTSNFSSICGKFDVIFTVNCSLAAALSTRIDSILLNFSFFLYCDADVAAMDLCNVGTCESFFSFESNSSNRLGRIYHASRNTV